MVTLQLSTRQKIYSLPVYLITHRPILKSFYSRT
nr:MAG TPA: hypothetical protein [Caudoviricetes sp.]